MIKSKLLLFLFLFLILIIAGCSSSKSSPLVPENPQADINLPATEISTDESSHSILGTWTLSINHENLEATVKQNRTLNAHHNVTDHIPTPIVTINSWDPVDEIIDVDITLENPLFYLNAFDVRLIIYTDDSRHILLNDDNWTRLWDIPGGQIANPFKAYAKTEPRRMFMGETWQTEKFQIKCSGSDFNVQFAVDASYPGNCEEPYEISNFHQSYLGEDIGNSAYVTVDVLHWQNDVSEVYLVCPEITGESETPFEYLSSNKWRLNLTNNTGASVGWYQAWIYAVSSGFENLEMIHRIRITVSPGTGIPQNPVNVGEYRTPLASCEDVCAHNGYLFALDAFSGLYVLDITNPSEPEIINNLPLGLEGGYYGNLDCSGNYALVGSSMGVSSAVYYVVDISDPIHLEVVGSIELNIRVHGMSYDGNYAVLGADTDLLVLDLSTPSNPVLAGTMALESAYPVLQGNYVYSPSNYWGSDLVSIIDISDPGNPVIVNTFDPMGSFCDSKPLSIDGDILCIASNTHPEPDFSLFVETVDVNDPLNPVRLGYFEFTGSAFERSPSTLSGVTALDSYVLFTRLDHDQSNYPWYSIYLMDISNPANIQKKDNIGGRFLNGAISGNFCYFDDFGLGILDFNDPGNLTPKSWSYRLNAGELKITDTGLAYVASWYNSLCVIDVNDPQDPQMLSSYSLDWYDVRDLAICNDNIFLSLHEFAPYSQEPDRILVLDATDPYSLSEITFLDVDYSPTDLYCNGEYLFVTADTGLLIYDVSNPQSLDLIGSLATSYLSQINLQDNHAFVLYPGNNGKFIVIDISDPTNPWIAGETDCYRPRDLEIQDDHAFVLGDEYMKIYDISNPIDPVEINEIDSFDDSNYYLSISGDYAYFGYTGEIWDFTDLQNPQYLSQLKFPSSSTYTLAGFEIVENYAFLSCGSFGLQINKLW